MRPVRALGFYEFFAGAGLVRLALEPDWHCLWANDIDQSKGKIYVENFGEDAFVRCDVAEVAPESLPGVADLAWASFPCQDLSLAGWGRGMSARRSGVFWAFWRIMHRLNDLGRRPPLIAIENVTGLLRGENFRGLCEALAALDMQFGAMVIDARRFLPQSRPRVFVVAVDSGVDVERFTVKSPPDSPWVSGSLLSTVTKLPSDLRELWRWWDLPVPTDPVPDLAGMIDDDPTEVAWHSKAETDHLLGLMTKRNRAKVEHALAAGGRRVGMLYRRTRDGRQRAEVRFDGVAGCLRTPQGGSSRQTVVVVRDGVVRTRLLSPREAARLMGAPDSFWLPESYTEAYWAMGDAVAVPAVEWLSRHLLTPLAFAARNTARRESRQSDASAAFRTRAESMAALWEASRA
jgi:DNA (cytosine-5)-methyltransferase 1